MSDSPLCRAISFDAGNTLLRVEPSVGAVYASEAKRFGVRADASSIDRWFREAWKALQSDAHVAFDGATSEAGERAWWERLVRESFRLAAPNATFEPDFDSFFSHLYERFAEPDVWHVYDDVHATLELLARRNIRLCVLSNWDSRLPRLLDALGLGHYFEFVLTSAEVGHRKPHGSMFDVMIERLALPKVSVLHVGDHEAEDVAGARAVGVRAVLLDRDLHVERDGVRIRSLSELLHFL